MMGEGGLLGAKSSVLHADLRPNSAYHRLSIAMQALMGRGRLTLSRARKGCRSMTEKQTSCDGRMNRHQCDDVPAVTLAQ
jgi:hypothetical protein